MIRSCEIAWTCVSVHYGLKFGEGDFSRQFTQIVSYFTDHVTARDVSSSSYTTKSLLTGVEEEKDASEKEDDVPEQE